MHTRAVLLINLGSPDSFQKDDVRNYLDEFLMDERVIDIPRFWRNILVRGIIIPFRTAKSAAKYKTIWTDHGSPLILISRQVQQKLAKTLQLPVELCMRYAKPSPAYVLDKLQKENPDLKEIILVPLYPHYAMSSYETAAEYVKQTIKNGKYPFQLKVVPPFYDYPGYIDSLANSIRPFLHQDFDHVLFSYHGIPERHIRKTDCTKSHCFSGSECCFLPSDAHRVCYLHQVKVTTLRVAEKLGLSKDRFSLSFQSRLGLDAWLKPYTSVQLKKFPEQGIKKLLVVSPAFLCDCLETLEEIHKEGYEIFMKAGGQKYSVVPCLNDRDEWIHALARLINHFMISA
jgi:ferrochelatase